MPRPPANSRSQRWRQPSHRLGLPLTQLRGHLDNGVGIRQFAQFGKALQHLDSQGSTAGAVFHQGERRARGHAQIPEHFGHLPRETVPEQRRDFRGGNEIASRPELARTGSVVAKTRRIQRLRHEGSEGPAATRRLQAGNKVCPHARRVSGLVRGQFGQRQARFHDAIITRCGHRIGILPSW